MKPLNFFTVLADRLRRHKGMIILYGVTVLVNWIVFSMYGLPREPFYYAWLLVSATALLYVTVGVVSDYRAAVKRRRMLQTAANDWRRIKGASDLCERDYQAFVRHLSALSEQMARQCAESRADLVDYFTAWVHQIKTPIAVLRMRLDEDRPEDRALLAELFRIEQYVEMALLYVRLDSESRDLLYAEYRLDDLIRAGIRKFASQYIANQVTLVYEGCGVTLITDKKWFGCVLDQLLSNAVKYAAGGQVEITVTPNSIRIRDNGIGIAKEDLPRIFEKGYTGINGRMREKSSGLGLYLCRKAADLLAMRISVESAPGQGSCFTVQWNTDLPS